VDLVGFYSSVITMMHGPTIINVVGTFRHRYIWFVYLQIRTSSILLSCCLVSPSKIITLHRSQNWMTNIIYNFLLKDISALYCN